MKFKKHQLENFSELLKSVRKDKNISIDEISIKTKIQKDHIISIEEGHFDKIPPGPYLELFIRDIFNELNIDYKEYMETATPAPKTDDAGDGSKYSFEEKPTTTNDVGTTKYLNYVVAMGVLVLLFIVYRIFMPAADREELTPVIQQEQEVSQENFYDSAQVAKEPDSLEQPDSLKQATTQKQEPQVVEQQTQRPRLPITRRKEWTVPPGPQITEEQLKTRYATGNLVEISATRGEVWLKYITRYDFWWKILEKGDSISFRIDEAIVLEMFYPDNADLRYLGEPIEVGGAKYIRYVIGMHTGVTLREVYQ